MKVGYLTYGLDRNPTGIGRYSLELLKALQEISHEFEIILLTTEQEDHHNIWKTFEHHPIPGCHLLPALMTLGNLEITLATRQYKLDLIHDPNGIAPFLGPFKKAKLISTIHDAFPYVYPEAHNHLDNWRYRWILPLSAGKANKILTDSNNSAHDIQKYLKIPESKIQVIYCATNSQFKPIPNSPERQQVLARYGISQPYLFYVGGLNARKNIAGLFESFAIVRMKFPGIKLVIGGKRQWKTGEIYQTLQKLNLEEYVDFTGYLKDEDLSALYSAAEAFVFPSFYEGFGLPPLEAMACGAPVITSNVSSLPEVVGDAALTVNPYNVEELAKAIIQVLGDKPLQETLRKRGLQRATQFTWEKTALETLEVYKQVLEI